MAFLMSVVHTATTASLSFTPIQALATSSTSQTPKFQNLNFSNSSQFITPKSSSLARNFTHSLAAVQMDGPSSDHNSSPHNGGALPELLTEYMVDMKCEGCVNSVKDKLQTVEGIKNIDVDLRNQVVRILGTTPLKTMTEAMELTGRKARLIGRSVPDDLSLEILI